MFSLNFLTLISYLNFISIYELLCPIRFSFHCHFIYRKRKKITSWLHFQFFLLHLNFVIIYLLSYANIVPEINICKFSEAI